MPSVKLHDRVAVAEKLFRMAGYQPAEKQEVAVSDTELVSKLRESLRLDAVKAIPGTPPAAPPPPKA